MAGGKLNKGGPRVGAGKPKGERRYQHGKKNRPAATNNHRQQHSQSRPSRVRFVGSRQPDTVEDDLPDSNNESTTKRNDKKRINRSACETNHSKRRLKRLLRAAHHHQAEVKNRRADERSDGDENGRQNQ